MQALWLEFGRTHDKGLRDRLILTYAPLVKYVAGRLGSGLPAHVDEGDLVSYGLLGLIGAIERYDPDRDVKFETYAIRSEEHTSELQSPYELVCHLRLEKENLRWGGENSGNAGYSHRGGDRYSGGL